MLYMGACLHVAPLHSFLIDRTDQPTKLTNTDVKYAKTHFKTVFLRTNLC